MKLYLSSYKVGNDPSTLVDLFTENKGLAYISNALDFSTDTERRKNVEKEQLETLAQLGLEPEHIDLRSYFDKKEVLKRDLSKFGGVWVNGGNTFVLALAYHQSGFDRILTEYYSDPCMNNFVYAGFSAAGCVLQKSLKGIDLVDDPLETKNAYDLDPIWEGVGLIDFTFVPHFESDHEESEDTSKEIEFYKKNNISYTTLHDGEVLLIIDGVVKLME